MGNKRYLDKAWEASENPSFDSGKTCLAVIPMVQTSLVSVFSCTAKLVFNIVS